MISLKISAKRLGKYPMYTGVDAANALQAAITVEDSARAWVQNWLREDFGVELN